jgi:nonsense-mediated mRNA decay protein 3
VLLVFAEVMNGVILQQSFVVEFIVQTQQCDACEKSWTADPWKAKLQLRQKVDHKRTFYYLEQVILKHGLYETMSKIKEEPDGLDFYFPSRSAAQKCLDFFNSVVPLRSKQSKRLVSQDYQSNLVNYKYTFYAEIAPVCRDDIIFLPKKLAQSMGGIAQMQLCVRVTSIITLVDPVSCQKTEIPQVNYYRSPFTSLMTSKNLQEYVVLDIQRLGPKVGKYALAEAQIARAADVGVNDDFITVKTHLGNLLHPGDTCMAYDLASVNLNDADLDGAEQSGMDLTDVVIVRKSFPVRNRRRKRKWALKQLDKETDEASNKKRDEDQEMRDLEEFHRVRAHFLMWFVSSHTAT